MRGFLISFTFMISFPNCKLNLGLNIVEKRSDGFHNLETVFLPIPLSDVLEVVESDQDAFELHGKEVPGKKENNIVLKALEILRKDFPQIPSLSIHLLKNIPTGAGLGGGSSNATYMLTMLNYMFQLGLSQEQLLKYALVLGSDCPFFLANVPSYAMGRGEILTPCSIDLSAYHLYMVKPELHIDTKWAFSNLIPKLSTLNCKEIVENYPISKWKEYLINDFEHPIFRLHPELSKLKEELYQAGAVYASMSGSGSTIYAIFNKSMDLQFTINKLDQKFIEYFTFSASL